MDVSQHCTCILNKKFSKRVINVPTMGVEPGIILLLGKENFHKATMSSYCIFILDENLLAIIKINKFNNKYWPRKSFSVIGISIKMLFYFF